MKHGFKTAGINFELIKEDTTSVIVQYKNERLINELYQAIGENRFYDIKIILMKLQPYTVNIRKSDGFENYTTRELDGDVLILTKDAYDIDIGINKGELQSLIF